jgi:predicted MPP superfamily phosphohydrolase
MTTRLSPAEEAPATPSPGEQPESTPVFPRREIAVFGSLVSAILLATNAFVCATWSHFFGLPGWLVWQVFPGALAIAFIPATILRFRYAQAGLRAIYAVSAAWLGALNFAFFAAAACWLIEGVAGLGGRPVPQVPLATFLFSLALLATAYGLVNGRWIRVSRVTVHLPHLPEVWQGRTAALVTDLHLGPLFGAGFLRRVIARLRSLRPDAVFISGDMFDGSTLGADRLVAPWRDFSAPQGIFYVTGNHDEFVERNIFLEAVRRVGIRVLNNEMVTVEGLQLIGIHDSEATDPVAERSILRRLGIDPARAGILLAHRPVNLAIAEEEGISLQLSGHTHGGQIWPWNLLVSRIYGRFAHGLGWLGKLQVWTSYGVGTWGPPLRVGTKSEIVLIRFEKEIEPA